jgi:hypothetical protein
VLPVIELRLFVICPELLRRFLYWGPWVQKGESGWELNRCRDIKKYYRQKNARKNYVCIVTCDNRWMNCVYLMGIFNVSYILCFVLSFYRILV